MKSLSAALLLLLVIFCLTGTCFAARGIRLLDDGPSYLTLNAGTFEGFDDLDNAFAAQVEFRYGRKFLYFGPLAGALVNADGGAAAYAGIYLDLAIGPFVLSPQTGVCAYERGDSKELGGTFQFLSALSLDYEFDGGWRLGGRYEHISNLNLHDKNPGADILLLNWGIPF